MKLWIADFESRNYTFTGAGLTKAKAKAALVAVLKHHTKQYDLDPDWYYTDDFGYTEYRAGQGRRDHRVLTTLKGTS